MNVAYLMNYLSAQIDSASASPWNALVVFTIHGGWIIWFIFFAFLTKELFHDRMMGLFAGQIQWTILAVTVPKLNEQTPRAVENFFTHLAGAHVTQDLIEKYWLGELQPWLSFEIVSIEGYLQFIVYLPKKFRDLVEASLYAQYPDAEIMEIEDYTKTVPHRFPNKEYDMWGTEFVYANKESYPMRTYEDFEHSVSKEFFKDPMAAFLETMSRIGEGEQFWIQILLKPIGKEWTATSFKLARELADKYMKEAKDEPQAALRLTKGEQSVIEAVHRKATKIGFKTKIRVVYVAKKENYNAKRIQYGIVGTMKQFARDDANALKPAYSETAVTAHYLFKDAQRTLRKNEIMEAYVKRSTSRGATSFVMNVEELATLWHFPVSHAVRAPQLKTTPAKTSEAPMYLPVERDFPVAQSSAQSAQLKSSKKQPTQTHKKGEPPLNIPFA